MRLNAALVALSDETAEIRTASRLGTELLISPLAMLEVMHVTCIVTWAYLTTIRIARGE